MRLDEDRISTDENESAVAPEPDLDRYFDIPYVADMFSVTAETVRAWINDGKLPASKLGGRYWRVKRADLIAFANSKYGNEATS